MKMNLIKKLALTLALAGTINLTACTDGFTDSQKSELTSKLSADISTPLTEFVAVIPEESTSENYYVSFLGHSHSLIKRSEGIYASSYVYVDHKDYRVTYQVTKDEYIYFNKMANLTTIKYIYDLLTSDFNFIIKIIDNSEPIEYVGFIPEEDKATSHRYKTLIPDEFKFNEEKYLEKININEN